MDAFKHRKPPAEDLEDTDEPVPGPEYDPPADEKPRESFVTRLKEQLRELGDRSKESLEQLKHKLKREPTPSKEEEEEELPETQDQEEGLTTVDPHFQHAFEQMQEEEARKEAEEAEEAARRAEAEAEAATRSGGDPALVEQLFMVLDKWEQIWVQQFQNTNTQLQNLEQKLEGLAEKLEAGIQAGPSLPPLPTAPIPIEGHPLSGMPPFPERGGTPGLVLPAEHSPPRPLPGTAGGKGAHLDRTKAEPLILRELEQLVEHPLSRLLSVFELDNVVALILEPLGVNIWQVQELRRTRTPHRDHHQSETQVRELLKNLDSRLKKVEGFEVDANRLGYLLEAFEDPIYRNLINQRAFLKGDGTLVPPTPAAYDKVTSAVGLHQWIEALEQGRVGEVTEQLIPENGELFAQRYYLLPPKSRERLHTALIDNYVAQRREQLPSEKDREGPAQLEAPTTGSQEALPEGAELVDESVL